MPTFLVETLASIQAIADPIPEEPEATEGPAEAKPATE
jgi:hypothetical protein